MDYVSKVDRERERWITVANGLRHIMVVNERGEENALRNLLNLADDEQAEMQWAEGVVSRDDARLAFCRDARIRLAQGLLPLTTVTRPPNKQPRDLPGLESDEELMAWNPADDDDLLHDDLLELEPRLPRLLDYETILVLRESVERWWPFHQVEPTNDKKQSTLHHPPSKAAIREELRKMFSDPAVQPPNMNVAWKRIPNARRALVWQVLREPEFDDLRPKAGYRKKKQ
jgi:hypothetical protein